MVAARAAAWLLLAAAACAPREQDFYDFKAVNIRGKLVSLEKYRGSVSVRPPGLGAAPPDPGRGAERPGPCRVGLRGARGVRSPSPGSPPPPRHPPPGVAPPDPRPGLSHDYVARPGVRGETRNSRCSRRFPSQRFWAAGRSLSRTGLKINSSSLCLSHPQFPRPEQRQLAILSAVRTLWK